MSAAVWPGRAGLAATRALGAVLPLPWLFALGRLAAPVLVASLGRLRSALLHNARHLLGPGASRAARRRLAVEVLASFARFAIEMLTARRGLPAGEELLAGAEGREHFEAADAAGRGIIAVTLHLGNYELGPLVLARLRQPLAILYTPDPSGAFEGARSRERRAAGIREIPLGGSPFFGVEALAVLRERGLVLLAADQGFAAAGGEPFPFLGGRARFHTWPARLALASGAPLLPCFVTREPGGRYRARIYPPVWPAEGEAPEALMARLLPVFERVLRRHPEQWLVIHRYWAD